MPYCFLHWVSVEQVDNFISWLFKNLYQLILFLESAGPYKVEDLIAGFTDLHKKYGNVVHLKLNQEIVLLFDPDDIQKMYQHEGKYPKRPTFEALIKYRKERHNCVGIVPE